MKKYASVFLGLLLAFNISYGQTSALVDAGGTAIVKKNTSDNWAKVYKKKVNANTQFLWYTTDSEGVKLPRGGQIAGTVTYSSLAVAESNIPPNYSLVTEDNPNITFENTTLQRLVDANILGSVDYDISINNTLGLSVFPSTPVVPSGDYKAQLDWGDAGLFRGNAEQILSLGLATAFDHNRMFTPSVMPVAHRYTWNLAPDSYTSGSDAEIEANGAAEYGYMFGVGGTRRDRNNAVTHTKEVHWDIETPAWTFTKAAAFLKGFHNAAIAYDADAVTIMYGKPVREFNFFWRMSSYFYDGDAVSNRRKLYPFMKNAKNYQNPSGLVTSYFSGKNVYFNTLPSYANACLPLSTSMYKKVDGVIQVDADGERDFVDNGFDETVRGINYHWEPKHPFDPVDPNQGPYKNFIHEAFCAVYFPYASYANVVYELRALQGGNDIRTTLNGNYKTCWMVRTTCEANPWQNVYRPLDRYTTKLQALLGHCMSNKLLLWSGWTGTAGFSDDGTSVFPTNNEGSGYAQATIEGKDSPPYNVNLGGERQNLAISYKLKMLNRDYGLFSSTDKLLTFTDPLQIQPRAEILGFGRLKNNYAYIVLAESRHDIGETMQITIGNTKNSTIFTRTLSAKQIIDEVFTFPSGDTYDSDDIWIQYQTIKAVDVKVSGDLQSHDI